MTEERSLNALAELALMAVDTDSVDRISAAFENEDIGTDSTAVKREAISLGINGLANALREVQNTWDPKYPLSLVGLAIKAAALTIEKKRERTSPTQVVWTGPQSASSGFRATEEVVKEIVESSKKELLVVGYWIFGGYEESGIVRKIFNAVSNAAKRGVNVTLVLDSSSKDQNDNFCQIQEMWPFDVAIPEIYTWDVSERESPQKLHAKILATDLKDGLVTSANLTHSAFELNMEMGVRISGEPVRQITNHFKLLIREGILRAFKK